MLDIFYSFWQRFQMKKFTKTWDEIQDLDTYLHRRGFFGVAHSHDAISGTYFVDFEDVNILFCKLDHADVFECTVKYDELMPEMNSLFESSVGIRSKEVKEQEEKAIYGFRQLFA